MCGLLSRPGHKADTGHSRQEYSQFNERMLTDRHVNYQQDFDLTDVEDKRVRGNKYD